MIPKTIRWRLPVSYAVIALMTALVLGGVLLVALQTYYRQQEKRFLTRSALSISTNLGIALSQGAAVESLQTELEAYSILTQTRVRYLSPGRQVVADTGIPGLGLAGLFTMTGLPRRPVLEFSPRFQFRFNGGGNGDEVETPAPPISTGQAEMPVEPPTPAALPTGAAEGNLPENYSFREDFPAFLSPQKRSDQVVSVAVVNPGDRSILGTVELSQMPDYGGETVSAVAGAWSLAGLVAVIFAALAGWFASRGISDPLLALETATSRMADGDLASRVQIRREDEIGRVAQAFNSMAGRIEGLVASLRHFAADAAHELNTPITALRNNLDLALEEEDPQELAGLVCSGREQAQRLEKLAHNLLTLARLESGAEGMERIPVDLVQLMRETSELYASQAEQAGKAFHLELPETRVVVQGDLFQLQRALSNLLENALKFTGQGGEIAAGLSHNQDWAEMWVMDTGIGIPDDEIPNLFAGFHRARNALSYAGSGLGLVIVRRIVENHGGSVRIENMGKGAKFMMRLPM